MEKIVILSAVCAAAWTVTVIALQKRVRRRLRSYRRRLEDLEGNSHARSLVRKSRFLMRLFFISPGRVGYLCHGQMETLAFHSIQAAIERKENDLCRVRILMEHEEAERAMHQLMVRERELNRVIKKLKADQRGFSSHR